MTKKEGRCVMSNDLLILGGTGAMGKALVEILSENKGFHVFVTSRKKHPDTDNVTYLQGNAKQIQFLEQILERKYTCIIDFMSYRTEEFRSRVDLLLNSTEQYIFISSARVFADSQEAITESSPRLLDISEDKDFLSTDDYPLAKARQENILLSHSQTNWTIVRPSKTFSEKRLQLGVLEKENWLFRAIHNRKIVFSRDLEERYAVMTTGYDVALGISSLIGKKDALSESYNIVSDHSYTWNEILSVYMEVLNEYGYHPQVFYTDKTTCLKIPEKKYQVLYGAYFSRKFDNTKIGQYVDTEMFTDAKTALKNCIREFLDHPVFQVTDWRLEALLDCETKEKTPLKEIGGKSGKLTYFSYRYHLTFLIKIKTMFKKLLKH